MFFLSLHVYVLVWRCVRCLQGAGAGVGVRGGWHKCCKWCWLSVWFAIVSCNVSECSSCSSCCCGWSPCIFWSPVLENRKLPPHPAKQRRSRFDVLRGFIQEHKNGLMNAVDRLPLPVWFWRRSLRTARRSSSPAPVPAASSLCGCWGRSCSPRAPWGRCRCPSPYWSALWGEHTRQSTL